MNVEYIYKKLRIKCEMATETQIVRESIAQKEKKKKRRVIEEEKCRLRKGSCQMKSRQAEGIVVSPRSSCRAAYSR